jgi:hypothetical protein
MLTIPRAAVRQFLQVLRKAGLLKPVRTNLPPCARLIASGQTLTLQSMDFEFSVAWSLPQTGQHDALHVPLSLFAEASQRTEGDVTFALRNDRMTAAWTDRGMPVERDADPIDIDNVPPMPVLPTAWAENPATLFAALRDAMATADPDSQRYALGCVQLDGAKGEIAATDSRQALIQGGFQFPWGDAVLIPARKIFRSDVFTGEAPVRIGRTDQQVVLQSGQWTLAFTTQTEGRFPEIHRIIPAESAIRTRLRLDPDDVLFVTERLDQLPLADDVHRAVTVDLNGAVAIRARKSAQATATELVLRRSQREGDEILLTSDRRYLQRALELGFTEFGFVSNESPIVCRDSTRQYIWMALAPGDAVPVSDDAYQVNSFDAKPGRSRVARHLASADIGRTTVRPAATKSVTTAAARRTTLRNPAMPKNSGSLPTNGDLIAHLLDLRKQVRSIEQAIVGVARQLRARRKQQQLMKTTLASLKQLQTLDV